MKPNVDPWLTRASLVVQLHQAVPLAQGLTKSSFRRVYDSLNLSCNPMPTRNRKSKLESFRFIQTRSICVTGGEAMMTVNHSGCTDSKGGRCRDYPILFVTRRSAFSIDGLISDQGRYSTIWLFVITFELRPQYVSLSAAPSNSHINLNTKDSKSSGVSGDLPRQ